MRYRTCLWCPHSKNQNCTVHCSLFQCYSVGQKQKTSAIIKITVLLVVLKSHFFRFLTCFFFNSTHCVQTKAHYINLVLLPRDIILQKEKKLVALNFGHGSNSIRENILSGQTGHPKSHHVQKNCELRF